MAELEKIEIKDNVLIKYLGNDINVIIPDGIIIIGKYAFNDCKDIESVAILEGVTALFIKLSIDYNKLCEVIITKSVISIDDSAFEGIKKSYDYR